MQQTEHAADMKERGGIDCISRGIDCISQGIDYISRRYLAAHATTFAHTKAAMRGGWRVSRH